MGCGSSKKEPEKEQKPAAKAADSKPKPKPEAAAAAKSQSAAKQSEETVPGNFERGVSFVVDVGDGEKNKSKRMPANVRDRLEKRGKTPTTNEELHQKQELATRRRERELEEKRAVAAAEDRKVAEARDRLDNKGNNIKQKMAREKTMTEQKREEALVAKKKTAQKSEQKGKVARARRHEVALQQAQQLESTENQGESDDDGEGETQEW